MSNGTKKQESIILIIDDDATVRQQLSDCLSRRNYKVILASDQASGKNKMKKNDVDLVLMDVMLPDGDNMHFCEELKSIRDVPIIIITGVHVSDAEEIQGFSELADDFIRKPITSPGVLVSRIEAALRKNKPTITSNTLVSGRYTLDLSQNILDDGYKKYSLTLNECHLMSLLMRNTNIILAYDTIIDKMYDGFGSQDKSIIHASVCRLKKKIKSDKDSPIECIRGLGYKWNSTKAQ